jgi:hypothetical protein
METESPVSNKRIRRRVKRSFRNQPVATLSLIISLLAVLIAAAGLYTSRQAFNQTIQQYVEERSLVLSAKFGDAADSLTVTPTDSGFHFMQGAIWFPSVFIAGQQPIQEDGNVWGMATVGFRVAEYVMKKYKAEHGFASVVEIGIPVLIRSVYSTKGRAYTDLSLYELKYSATIVEEKDQPIGPKFVGLTFVAHMNPEGALPQNFLDETFSRGRTQLGH